MEEFCGENVRRPDAAMINYAKSSQRRVESYSLNVYVDFWERLDVRCGLIASSGQQKGATLILEAFLYLACEAACS